MINISSEFVLAGDATFTVENGKGEHFTYHVGKSESDAKRPKLFFARVLAGAESTDTKNNFKYVGVVDPKSGTIRMTKASKFSDSSKEYLVLAWALKQVWSQRQLPEGYTILHKETL